MNYNDFPTISEIDYDLINKQYSINNQKDRKEIVFKICREIESCVLSFFQIENKYNQNILKSLTLSNETLKKIQNNIISCFNIPTFQIKQIKNFSVFSFLKNLNEILTLLIEWKNIETKTYYEKLISNSIFEILNIQNTTLNSLNKSSIIFFKHM